MLHLDGKVALVTGGSRGMGAAIAKRLAREGAAVAQTYDQSEAKARAVAEGIESAGGRALVIQANARDTDAVKDSVGAVVAEFGHLDILVNNAGVFDVADISELNLEHYEHTMDINVRAVFVATRPQRRTWEQAGGSFTSAAISPPAFPGPASVSTP